MSSWWVIDKPSFAGLPMLHGVRDLLTAESDDHRYTVVVVMVSEKECQNSISSLCSLKTTIG